MAAIGNTQGTHDVVGQREDLSDIIYNISPTETPFMMMIGRGTATNITHEWQVDTLATEAWDNAQSEGDDSPAFPDAVETVRINNEAQISRKLVIISGTVEAVDKAGRKSELAYQLAKRAKELKRDMESIVIAGRTSAGAVPQGKTAGSTINTVRTLAPYETWMVDNAAQPNNRATDGTGTANTDGFSPTAAKSPVDGTQRAFLESQLKEVIRECWTQGGDPSVVMVGPFNKQVLSGFTGNATRFDRSEDMRLVTAVDVYVSDFGEHRVVPNRFSRDRSALVITPRLWSIDYIRGFRQFALAKTGDAEKRQILAEYTLRCGNCRASGVIADLLTS